MSGAAWLDAVPNRFRAVLSARLPPNIALMRLLSEASSQDEAQEVLADALARAPADAGTHLAAIADLSRRLPDAWSLVRGVLKEAEHETGGHADPVAHWAAVFDRLARTHPEAGVALYALGSPAMLAVATAEIVAQLRGWDLVGENQDVLEIGCGIGRFVAALAPLCGSVVGLDVSGEMIAEARRRCAAFPNVRLERSSGHDLAGVPDGSVDLVLAADVFPYLVLADVAAAHLAEAARVLRPGGALAILNFSYRGDLAADRREMADLCGAHGFALLRDGTRDFAHWDGVTFLARRDQARTRRGTDGTDAIASAR